VRIRVAAAGRAANNSLRENYVDDSDYRAGPAVDRSFTDVALQFGMGILPQRWAWPGGDHSDHPGAHGQTLAVLVAVRPTSQEKSDDPRTAHFNDKALHANPYVTGGFA
jgi:hypothetical protein